MIIGPSDLGSFVAESDRLGGPTQGECQAYWNGFHYQSDIDFDRSLDPFGSDYLEQQLSLYRELSGRSLNQSVNEFTSFDLQCHVNARNPYDHPNPAVLSLQIEQLSRAFRFAGIKRDGNLLDMGCGWGLSSELGAYLGMNVTSVDVNSDFVRLVGDRAQRSGLPIQALQSEFDHFDAAAERYDTILFYECLHHAVTPWTLLMKLGRALRPGGKLVMVGEPINENWWANWGLRLDPMSVYCIHKFGWFESGWSLSFLKACLESAHLSVSVHNTADHEVGTIVTATAGSPWTVSGMEAVAKWPHAGWIAEGGSAIATKAGWIDITFPAGATTVEIDVANFRGRPIDAHIGFDGKSVFDGSLTDVYTKVILPRTKSSGHLSYVSETWLPGAELGAADDRTIGFHLRSLHFC